MARKQQKKKPAARQRPRVGAAGSSVAPAPASPPARAAGGESLVRSVEMSLAPRGAVAGAGRRVQRGLALDADPAIPLDRVPYFTADLAKLGIVAAIMLVLLLGGSQLIPILLK